MGHKFQDRFREPVNGGSYSETSPVFLQFLECVWQLMQQNPGAFQFNDSLLIAILEVFLLLEF